MALCFYPFSFVYSNLQGDSELRIISWKWISGLSAPLFSYIIYYETCCNHIPQQLPELHFHVIITHWNAELCSHNRRYRARWTDIVNRFPSWCNCHSNHQQQKKLLPFEQWLIKISSGTCNTMKCFHYIYIFAPSFV